MDELNQLISPETQATILQILAVLTVALPLLEKLAARTANKVDDRIVDGLQKLLSLVPRVRLGGK
jgi:hypothetical protein